jgi:hypothetical protein
MTFETYTNTGPLGKIFYYCTNCRGWVNTYHGESEFSDFTIGEHTLVDCFQELLKRVTELENRNER